MKKIIIICSTVLIAVICFLGIDKYKKENAITIKELSKDNSYLILYIKNKDLDILFDLGLDNKRLYKCLKNNNLNLRQMNYVAISHRHSDHIGELSKMQNKNFSKETKILINDKIFNEIREKHRQKISKIKTIMRTQNDYSISKNIIYTNSLLGSETTNGVTSEVYESFLIIKKHNKLTIISGCAHPGIIEMVEYAKKITGCDKINAVVGGLGVIGEKEARYLNDTKADIYPIHCTEYKEGSLLKVKTLPVVIK